MPLVVQTSMGGAGGNAAAEKLLRRSELLHVVQKPLRLFRGYAFFAVRRHVRRLLGFLTLQDCVDVLLVSERRIEFLFGLLPVASDTFRFEKGGRVGRLCFTLSG